MYTDSRNKIWKITFYFPQRKENYAKNGWNRYSKF